MVKSVEQDSRGIIDPASGLTAFRLTRHAASGGLERFVDRYWIATWDLPPGTEHTQSVLVHPVVNIVFDAGGTVSGVQERTFTRTLAGSGRVLGIMFRPAGFRPFWERPARELTNRALPLTTVLGPDAGALQAALDAAEDEEAMVEAAERLLRPHVPDDQHPGEATTALVERVASDRGIRRVDQVAELAGVGVRTLQRRFADHVGVSPKWVIRRYRLYDAAEAAARGQDVAWADLADQLGYSDQAHLTRDFTAAIGMPPERYSRHCAQSTA